MMKEAIRNLFDHFMSVLNDKNAAIHLTIDMAWIIGRTPETFGQSAINILEKVRQGHYPEITDFECDMIKKAFLQYSTDVTMEEAGEMIYDLSRKYHSQSN